jgi:hypothetical protein
VEGFLRRFLKIFRVSSALEGQGWTEICGRPGQAYNFASIQTHISFNFFGLGQAGKPFRGRVPELNLIFAESLAHVET